MSECGPNMIQESEVELDICPVLGTRALTTSGEFVSGTQRICQPRISLGAWYWRAAAALLLSSTNQNTFHLLLQDLDSHLSETLRFLKMGAQLLTAKQHFLNGGEQALGRYEVLLIRDNGNHESE